MTLEGKSVLVTGAGTGIGRWSAIRAAERGAAVTVMGRREHKVKETADMVADAGGEALVVAGDVACDADAESAVAAAVARFGGVDGLVNNAGSARFASIEDARLDDLQTMFDAHVRGPVVLIRAALPSLRERRGAVVNVTSVGGALATPRRSFYGATKAAINHLTRSLALELAPDVRVNAILPGPVDTPIYDDLGMSEQASSRLRGDMVSMTPLGRFGQPWEVADWVCALLDDTGAWMTGSLLPVDGGRCA